DFLGYLFCRLKRSNWCNRDVVSKTQLIAVNAVNAFSELANTLSQSDALCAQRIGKRSEYIFKQHTQRLAGCVVLMFY
ncbi:hypothetical protein L0668_17275, partial [Paraglaciecola aquimarina]